MIAKWRTWQQWPCVTGKIKGYVITECHSLNVKMDCMITMWRGVNVEMKDCSVMPASNAVEDGGLFADREWLVLHADRWFLWSDCSTCIMYRPMIPVAWLWHKHCVQSGDSCGVTVTHAFFTDWLFLGCDCECDTCDSCVGVVICCNSYSEFYAGCFSLWHAHSTDKGDSCGVTTTRASLRPVVRVVWLWHMRPADRCLCVVTLTHASFRPVIHVVWLWHIHHAEQWHLWCDCDTRIMQTCGVCGMNMAHASCRGFMWCNCGTCIMQTGDSSRVIVIHASCRPGILVVLL